MNVEQLKEYLAKITNTQKPVCVNETELEENNIIDDNDKLKINIRNS